MSSFKFLTSESELRKRARREEKPSREESVSICVCVCVSRQATGLDASFTVNNDGKVFGDY